MSILGEQSGFETFHESAVVCESSAEHSLVFAIVQEVLLQKLAQLRKMKAGMTNKTYFAVTLNGDEYVIRLNGTGSSELLSRTQEQMTYAAIRPFGFGTEMIAIDPVRYGGYMVSRYIHNARPCDANLETDVNRAMAELRRLHESNISVEYEFDIYAEIERYESLHADTFFMRDYQAVRSSIMALKDEVKDLPSRFGFAHIDAVPDNVLIAGDTTYLIDWEYAAMADTLLDIAMFGIYAGYDETGFLNLLHAYYPEGYSKETEIKVFSYAAAGGLLWSLWCAYKAKKGIHFGRYAAMQYGYARTFPKLVRARMEMS